MAGILWWQDIGLIRTSQPDLQHIHLIITNGAPDKKLSLYISGNTFLFVIEQARRQAFTPWTN
jgi:hypothetical protein